MHNAHASPLGENVAEKHPTLWESYTQHFIQRIVYLLIQIFLGGVGGRRGACCPFCPLAFNICPCTKQKKTACNCM